jgi:hypothetical protein
LGQRIPSTEYFQAKPKGDNVQNDIRVRQSVRGYRVELCCDGAPYVTFMDGLTREGAEREALSLAALWARISVPQLIREPPRGVEKTVSQDRPQTGRHTIVGDWT